METMGKAIFLFVSIIVGIYGNVGTQQNVHVGEFNEAFDPKDNFKLEMRNPKILVKGHVVCDRCGHGAVGKMVVPLQDAEVGVKCTDLYGFVTFSGIGYTDTHGIFSIPMDDIPGIFGVKGCKAKLLRGPGVDNCNMVSTMGDGHTGAPLTLMHKSLREVIFTSGPFACTTSIKPSLCNTNSPVFVYVSPPPPPSYHPPPSKIPSYHSHPPPIYHVLSPVGKPPPTPVKPSYVYVGHPPPPSHHSPALTKYTSPPPPHSPPPLGYPKLGPPPLGHSPPPPLGHSPPPHYASPPLGHSPSPHYTSPPLGHSPPPHYTSPPLGHSPSTSPPLGHSTPPPSLGYSRTPPPTYPPPLGYPKLGPHHRPPPPSGQSTPVYYHSPPPPLHHESSPVPKVYAPPPKVYAPPPKVYASPPKVYASPPPPKKTSWDFGVKTGSSTITTSQLPEDNMKD